MKFEFNPKLSYVDAFGTLLDVGVDSTECAYEVADQEVVIFSVDEHFRVVGNRMREAMITFESEEGATLWQTGRQALHR
jgi:hypothetical protein